METEVQERKGGKEHLVTVAVNEKPGWARGSRPRKLRSRSGSREMPTPAGDAR
jgi:hypothetical protein